MSSNPLQLTRIYFRVKNTDSWYRIIREANALYKGQWQGQPHVKRKLERRPHEPLTVWFDVPDQTFASWVSVKHGIVASLTPTK